MFHIIEGETELLKKRIREKRERKKKKKRNKRKLKNESGKEVEKKVKYEMLSEIELSS